MQSLCDLYSIGSFTDYVKETEKNHLSGTLQIQKCQISDGQPVPHI